MPKGKNILTTDIVKHVATLAKLDLSAAELKNFQDQLSSILHLVEQVSKVETTNVEPTSQVTGMENVMREDKVGISLSQDEVLRNASRKHNGYFVVDAIFED